MTFHGVRIPLLLTACAAVVLLAQPLAAQPFQETMVDPQFTDCAGTGGPIPPNTGWLGGWGGGSDLDNDFRGGPAETGDGDLIFGTIGNALLATLPGGVVEIPVPGVYRERLVINQSVTLRAPEGVKVVLEGGHQLCVAPPPAMPFNGITIQGNITVILENLTIRGFDSAIVITGDESRVIVRNCRIEDNEWAGISAGNGTLSVEDTVFLGRTNAPSWAGIAILGSGHTQVSQSYFAALTYGIRAQSGEYPARISVHRSRIVQSLDTGIHLQNADLMVSDSLVAQSENDGVFAANYIQGGSSTVTLEGNRFEMNGRDGVRTDTLPGPPPNLSAVTLGFSRNESTHNAGMGVNVMNLGIIDCAPGRNVLKFNTGGPGPAACIDDPAANSANMVNNA